MLVTFLVSFYAAARQVSKAAQNIIASKALEAETSSQPGVTIVLFHQRDKKDQAVSPRS